MYTSCVDGNIDFTKHFLKYHGHILNGSFGFEDSPNVFKYGAQTLFMGQPSKLTMVFQINGACIHVLKTVSSVVSTERICIIDPQIKKQWQVRHVPIR